MVKRGVLKEYSKAINISKRILDILIIVASAYLAYIYKFGADKPVIMSYLLMMTAGTLFAVICFSLFPLYRAWRGITLFAEFKMAFVAWLVPWLLLIVVSFGLKISTLYSREWVTEWFFFALFLLLLYRLILRIILRHYRRIGFNQRSVCLVTHGNYGADVYKNILRKPEFGYKIIAVFSNENNNEYYKDKLLGSINDSYKWLHDNDVDQLWIAIPLEKVSIVKKIFFEMRHKTADIRFIPDLGSYNLLNHSISEVGGMPIVDLSVSPMQENAVRLLKRIEDLFFGTLILLLISPILFLISIIIKLTSHGPVFYKQTRVGINNKPFTMLKFRSMPVNAEKDTGAVWAKQGESRATAFGSFLRKTSLDELPQFINVIKGDMSIVGPRPERPEFVEQFKEKIPFYMKKHMVKAGITGWAQINGWRGNTDLKKRIEYDIYYMENWSLLFDIKIIFLTMVYGFIHKNAY